MTNCRNPSQEARLGLCSLSDRSPMGTRSELAHSLGRAHGCFRRNVAVARAPAKDRSPPDLAVYGRVERCECARKRFGKRYLPFLASTFGSQSWIETRVCSVISN